MIPKQLIQAAVAAALIAAASGQIPEALTLVRQAQLQLIQDSKASKWGQALLLPSK